MPTIDAAYAETATVSSTADRLHIRDGAVAEIIDATTQSAEARILVVVMTQAGNIADVSLATVMRTAAMTSTAVADTPTTTQQQITAAMISLIQASTPLPMFESDGQVWAVNLDSAASSSYEQYAFNSFALFESACFGAKADGVYLLAGDTDAGADVRASISFGKLNFGNTLRKHVPNVYIGVASTGLMLLKVTVEGDEYIYEARRSDDEMRAQRFDLGKGLKASYYTFELFNKAGADFELDTIEFRALANSRRI